MNPTHGNNQNSNKRENQNEKRDIAGTASHNAPKAKSTVKEYLHKAGDALERTGESLKKKDFKKIGEAVEKVGDKIEHLAD